MKQLTLTLKEIGQITCADIAFGDLTVLVGPQATGKSIFLQFLKLVLDIGYVHEQLRKHGIDWGRSFERFLAVYLGEGMQGVWHTGQRQSTIEYNERRCDPQEFAQLRNRSVVRKLFYIPAQRVLTLANGWPRPFTAFGAEDPFVVRDFSETFRLLMEQELGQPGVLFPKANRLKSAYRELLERHLFGGFSLQVDRHGSQKRLILQNGQKDTQIAYMAWSAGQREFVPLLLSLYWLMPSAKVRRRDEIRWVVIEEPEMGLHPNAIATVLLLIAELLWRGYRVCLSTHSTHVIDLVWAIETVKKNKGDVNQILELFDLSNKAQVRQVAQEVCKKTMRVYYFDRNGRTKDISNLDPGADDRIEAGWGGLTEFSGRVNEVVAQVVGSRRTES